MKLAMIHDPKTEKEIAAIETSKGLVPIHTINELENKQWAVDLFTMLREDQWKDITTWWKEGGQTSLETMPSIPFEQVSYAPPMRTPGTIWGIGFNYVTDLSQKAEQKGKDPVTFLKPTSTIIGLEENIVLPSFSKKTTGEGEIVMIIGKRCKNVSVADVPEVIAGLTTGIDMTEADIHAANPRYLARAKSFDSFFSYGPQVVSLDEIDDLSNLTIATVQNEEVIHENSTSHLIYSLSEIVAHISNATTLLPGDVILTGTPGPTVLRNGDQLECRVDGFESLKNSVVQG
ncbi:fumarylacetoacetate hydrolase [Salipaludibacillus keqinensis]|uniref:Fumarylacetoacetate hydrolase n=1 Tax=Salipaludibacillus keqinensis TaxID=2045207 RepID=A0A323TJ46_9BACI|nr:fumarylacetoacetate hydrolase family protein [Salipaludibacillus keqinensis]PYZ94739.1 fumarylacetoacetate hydrolase [Salipaludibacillus keqinensis]